MTDPKPKIIIDTEALARAGAKAGAAIRHDIERITRTMAAAQERHARTLVLASLPRPLKWMVDHPRLLRVYYRLRPKRRPVMYVRR